MPTLHSFLHSPWWENGRQLRTCFRQAVDQINQDKENADNRGRAKRADKWRYNQNQKYNSQCFMLAEKINHDVPPAGSHSSKYGSLIRVKIAPCFLLRQYQTTKLSIYRWKTYGNAPQILATVVASGSSYRMIHKIKALYRTKNDMRTEKGRILTDILLVAPLECVASTPFSS